MSSRLAALQREPLAVDNRAMAPRLRVLLIDDDEDDFVITNSLLHKIPDTPYYLDWADSYEAGLKRIREGGYDACLVDYRLGDRSGIELVREVASLPESPPMILLTGQGNQGVDVEAMESGATDFLVKGVIDAQLLERSIRYSVERKRMERRLVHQATHDGLTGLANRRLFLDRLGMALARMSRQSSCIAVMFIDLDRFKVVNDELGHDAGDKLLVAVSKRLSTALRPYDTVARFGGDEFVVLCENLQDAADAVPIAERLKTHLSGTKFTYDTRSISISATVGIAFATNADCTAEDMLRDADAAMYRAKDHSRGGIEVSGETTGTVSLLDGVA